MNKASNTVSEKEYFEKDNVGTRTISFEDVQNRSSAHKLKKGGFVPPHLIYRFAKREQAVAAMLEIPYIKVAKDSGNLICLEILEFGVYEVPYEIENKCPFWHVILRGDLLTLENYRIAENIFLGNAGIKISADEPSLSVKNENVNSKPLDEVIYLREERFDPGERMGGIKTGIVVLKKRYKATTKEAALSFLKQQTVNKDFYYIEIETPVGLIGKDKDGIYGE